MIVLYSLLEGGLLEGQSHALAFQGLLQELLIFLEALPLLLSDFLLVESGRAPVHVLQHLISLLHRVVHILAIAVAGLWY